MLIGRSGLDGAAADAVGRLFAQPAESSVGVLSVLLLLFSGVSLTRRMQVVFRHAWRLDPLRGVASSLDAALGLTALVLGIAVQYQVRSLVGTLPDRAVLVPALFAATSVLLWLVLPWLVLDRRVGWRELLPGAALTAAGTSLYALASTPWSRG